MKKTLLILVLGLVLVLSGCTKKIENNIVLGGFESDELSSWSVVNGSPTLSTSIYFDSNRRYLQEGSTFLTTNGSSEDVEVVSNNFVLEGLGYVTFLISGGSASSDMYVGLYVKETDEELLTATNQYYDGDTYKDNFTRIVWEVSDYIGSELYIKIVDHDASYLNVDAFDSYIETDEELAVYQSNLLERIGFRTENLLSSAENYINMNKQYVDSTHRYSYHLMGEIGWINDPNGFVYYNGQYNLFYQHNPYSTVWGPMHWGHAVTDDLVKWEYMPIAVAPLVFDAGGGAAFSGSAIEVDGDLYLLYTENWIGYQYQVISKSTDGGVTFEKINDGLAVIDDSDLPFYANPVDFRDPKIFEYEGMYYSVVGSRQINDFGQVLLFESENLVDWEYVGPVIQGSLNTYYTLGYMFECPDLFMIEDQSVLIMSPQEIPGHRNTHGTVYVVGDMNFESGMLENWDLANIKEIDYGFDFYAPQTTIDDQGRRIMVAWMQSWNRSPMTSQYGWAGAMTFPRELTLNEDNELIQYPIVELENYRENQEVYSQTVNGLLGTGITGNVADLEVSFKPGEGQTGITVYGDEEGNGTHIYYQDGYVYLDRADNMGGRYPGDFYNITKAPVELNEDGSIDLRILLDQFSIEVFINGGEQAITTTVYSSNSTDQIYIFSDSSVEFDIMKWDLVID